MGPEQKGRPLADPAATGVFSGRGVGRKEVVGKPISSETGQRKSTTVSQKDLDAAQSGIEGGRTLSTDERKSRFKASKGETQGKPLPDLVTQKPATDIPDKPKRSSNVTTSFDTKKLGRKFSEFGSKTDAAQRSVVGALGGLGLKSVVPASAAAEAGLRFARGDNTGGILSGLQSMGGGLGFTAGVLNALRSMNPPKPRTDTGAITKLDPKKLLKKGVTIGGALEVARRGARALKGKSLPSVQGGRAGFRSAGG